MQRRFAAVSPPLILAIAGVFIVVFQWAVARPLWLDEQMIALNFRDRGFGNLHGGLWLDQSAPLGWMWLERLVLITVGSSELALRAVPMAFGVGTVLAALFVGRRFLTMTGASVLVALCSFGQWISFHSGELKSYSADTFFGLLLPALTVLAAGAVSGAVSEAVFRRTLVLWAAAAALGHWFSLGALLVLPACAAVLAIALRRNAAGMRLFATMVLLAGASLAAHYMLNWQHSQTDRSLQDYWDFAHRPEGTALETLQWLYGRLEPIAAKPGGTSHAVAFWLSAIAGLVLARNRWLAAAAGAVVLSGFVFAGLRIIPLYERLSLWMLPSIYLAVALAADEAVRLVAEKPWRPRWTNAAVAVVVAAMVLAVSIDAIETGIRDVAMTRGGPSNHDTDDRSGIAWLIAQRRPGDVVVTTKHALPALWWYGGLSLADGRVREFPDGSRIFTAEYFDSADCGNGEPRRRLAGKSRMLVYLGFVDMPEGFDDLLLDKLSHLGDITVVREFDGRSRAAVVDPAVSGRTGLFWSDADKASTSLKGCVAIRAARAW